MTQAALAWQARTTQGTVTQLETGRRTVAGVSLGLANRLAGALGIGLEEWAELAGMRGVAYSRHVTEAEWAEPPADTSGEPGDPPGDDSTAPDGATEEEQQ